MQLSDFEEFESLDGICGKSRRKANVLKFFLLMRLKNFNLDIRWLKDDSVGHHEELYKPDELIIEAKAELEAVLEELNNILDGAISRIMK